MRSYSPQIESVPETAKISIRKANSNILDVIMADKLAKEDSSVGNEKNLHQLVFPSDSFLIASIREYERHPSRLYSYKSILCVQIFFFCYLVFTIWPLCQRGSINKIYPAISATILFLCIPFLMGCSTLYLRISMTNLSIRVIPDIESSDARASINSASPLINYSRLEIFECLFTCLSTTGLIAQLTARAFAPTCEALKMVTFFVCSSGRGLPMDAVILPLIFPAILLMALPGIRFAAIFGCWFASLVAIVINLIVVDAGESVLSTLYIIIFSFVVLYITRLRTLESFLSVLFLIF